MNCNQLNGSNATPAQENTFTSLALVDTTKPLRVMIIDKERADKIVMEQEKKCKSACNDVNNINYQFYDALRHIIKIHFDQYDHCPVPINSAVVGAESEHVLWDLIKEGGRLDVLTPKIISMINTLTAAVGGLARVQAALVVKDNIYKKMKESVEYEHAEQYRVRNEKVLALVKNLEGENAKLKLQLEEESKKPKLIQTSPPVITPVIPPPPPPQVTPIYYPNTVNFNPPQQTAPIFSLREIAAYHKQCQDNEVKHLGAPPAPIVLPPPSDNQIITSAHRNNDIRLLEEGQLPFIFGKVYVAYCKDQIPEDPTELLKTIFEISIVPGSSIMYSRWRVPVGTHFVKLGEPMANQKMQTVLRQLSEVGLSVTITEKGVLSRGNSPVRFLLATVGHRYYILAGACGTFISTKSKLINYIYTNQGEISQALVVPQRPLMAVIQDDDTTVDEIHEVLEISDDNSFEPQCRTAAREDHYTTQIGVTRDKRLKKYKRALVNADPTGDAGDSFEIQYHKFCDLMVNHGYLPKIMAAVPTEIVNQSLDNYIQSGVLQSLYKIKRLNQQHVLIFGEPLHKLNAHVVPKSFGRQKRKILVKAWRSFSPLPDRVSQIELLSHMFEEQMDRGEKKETGFFSSFTKSQHTTVPPPTSLPKPHSSGIMDSVGSAIGNQVKDAIFNIGNTQEGATMAKNIGASFAAGMFDQANQGMSELFVYIKTSFWEVFNAIPNWIKYSVLFAIFVGVFLSIFDRAMVYAMRFGILKAAFKIDKTMSSLDHMFVEQSLTSTVEGWFKAGALGMAIKNFAEGSFQWQKVIDKSARLAVSLKNLHSFADSISGFFKNAINVVYEHFTGVPFFSDSAMAKLITERYNQFMLKVSAVDESKIIQNNHLGLEIVEDFKMLQLMFTRLGATVDLQTKNQIAMYLSSALVKVQTVYKALSTRAGRQEPVWVNFFGPPKQGKSTLIKGLGPLLYEVLSAGGFQVPTTFSNNEVFFRNATETFWSGYHGQWISIYDDLFQVKDIMCKTRSANELISACNTVLYPLDMADLSSKGTTFFESKLIFSTSNAEGRMDQDLGILSPEAFYRRQNFSFEVKLKKHIPGKSSVTYDDLKNLSFTLHFIGGERANKKEYDIDEVIGMIVDSYAVREKEYQESLRADHSTFKTAATEFWKKKGQTPVTNSNNSSKQIILDPLLNELDSKIKSNEQLLKEINEALVKAKDEPNIVIPTMFGNFETSYHPFGETTTTTNTVPTNVTTTDIPVVNFVDSRAPIYPTTLGDMLATDFEEQGMLDIAKGKFGWCQMQEGKCTCHPNVTLLSQQLVNNILGYTSSNKCYYTVRHDFWNQISTNYSKDSYAQATFWYNNLMTDENAYFQWKIWKSQKDDGKGVLFNLKIIKTSIESHRYNDKLEEQLNDYFGGPAAIRFRSYGLLSGIVPDDFAKAFPLEQRKIISARLFGSPNLCRTYDELDTIVRNRMMGIGDEHVFTGGIGGIVEGPLHASWLDIRRYILENVPANMIEEVETYLVQYTLTDPVYYEQITYLTKAQKFDLLAKVALIGTIVMGIVSACVSIFCIFGLNKTSFFTEQSKDKYQEKITKRVYRKPLVRRRPIKFQLQNGRPKYDEAKVKDRLRQFTPDEQKLLNEFEAQSTADSQADSLMDLIYSHCQYYAEFTGPKSTACAYVTFWKGSICSANHHILDSIGCSYSNPPTITLGLTGDTTKTYTVSKCVGYPDRDVVYFRLHNCQPFRDITSHMREAPLEVNSSYPVRCSYHMKKEGEAETYKEFPTPGTSVKTSVNVDNSGIGGSRKWKGVYMAMNCVGILGECGQTYVHYNTHEKQKVLGIHGASNGVDSVICPVFRSDLYPLEQGTNYIEQAIMDDKYLESMFEENGIDYTHTDEFFCDGMRPIYKLSKSASAPQHTQFVPTPLMNGIDVKVGDKTVHYSCPYVQTEAPALLKNKLTPKGMIEPHKLSYRKIKGRYMPAAPPQLYDHDCWDRVFPDLNETSIEMLTIQEAVFGKESIGLPAIDFTTSAAVPFSLKGQQRKDLLKRDPTAVEIDKMNDHIRATITEEDSKLINFSTKFIHPSVIKDVNYRIKMAKLGIVVPQMSTHCLKDETRPLSRVELGYTRAFQIAQLGHLIFSRMCLGMLMIQTEHSQKTSIGVGINPFSQQWAQMFRRLARFGIDCKNASDTDVAGWDLFYMIEMAAAFVIELAWRTGRSIDELIFRCMYSALMSSFCVYILIGCFVYLCLMMVSGSLATSYMNTVFNCVKTSVIFKVSSIEKLGEAVPFKDNAEDALYGDDSIVTWKPEHSVWFNGKVIAYYAKKLFAHVHTDPSKGDDIPEGRNLLECELLKRRFAPLCFDMDGNVVTDISENITLSTVVVLAPISPATLENMCMWVQKPKDGRTIAEAFSTNVHNAMREWALHGSQQFERNKKILNVFLRGCGQPLYTEEYIDVRRMLENSARR